MKYRKKPVVIEAIQWTGSNFDQVANFTKQTFGHKVAYEDYAEYCQKTGEFTIDTLEGRMTATKGDFIIKGVKGECYPCKPDIFEATYEKVEE